MLLSEKTSWSNLMSDSMFGTDLSLALLFSQAHPPTSVFRLPWLVISDGNRSYSFASADMTT